jgi:hypothetical protein
MASLTDRLSKLEAALSPADYRPRVSLEQITDDDLRALEALTEEQLARVNAHPDVAAMLGCNALTADQGARMADVAREVMSCA